MTGGGAGTWLAPSTRMRSTPARLLALVVAAACGSGEPARPADAAGQSVDDGGTVADAGGTAACLDDDPFDPDALREVVTWLAADERRGRAPGTPEDDATRAFIADRFACLGLTPGMGDSFHQPFTARQKATGNVIGYLPGGDPALASEIVLVGAHHDHLGVRDGMTFNGANDNASGVAALLAMAQVMASRPAPPRRTVAFAAFGFEENVGDCLGSEFYADNPPPALPVDDVVYMVDADMVGTYPSEGSVVAYGSLAGTPARALLDQLAPATDLTVELGQRAGVDDSDFQAFCDRGIPYVYFETWDADCYHQPCDDVDGVDFTSMAAVTALLAGVVTGLVDGDVDLAAAHGAAPCSL